MLEPYVDLRGHYLRHWAAWQDTLLQLDEPQRERDLYRASAAMFAVTSRRTFWEASLPAFPFPGDSTRETKTSVAITLSGRVIWSNPRRTAGGGRGNRRHTVLRYLESTQEADGHWAQNMWLDGRRYWSGLQMDETAFPILLIDLCAAKLPQALGDLNRWWEVTPPRRS